MLLIIINAFSSALRPVVKTDAWTENTLYEIRENISNYANGDGKRLPESLWDRGFSENLENTIKYTPNTKPPEKSERSGYGVGEYIFYYQLCANFKKDSGSPKEPKNINGIYYDYAGYKISEDGYQRYHEFDKHRKGYYCFKIKTG